MLRVSLLAIWEVWKTKMSSQPAGKLSWSETNALRCIVAAGPSLSPTENQPTSYRVHLEVARSLVDQDMLMIGIPLSKLH